MQDRVLSVSSPAQVARDFVTLVKPRITLMVLITTLGGYLLGTRFFQVERPAAVWLPLLLGSSLIVAGANTLNMWMERDSDRFMKRTSLRPLPQGRLNPDSVLWFGIGLSVVSLPLLYLVHLTTALLGLVALLSYVLLYTPLKQRTALALLVGAVPGALPPLMGWSAARGTVDGPGVVLFAILFLWQVPHFLAIATFRQAEYERAGIRVLPAERGRLVTRHQIVRYSAALVLTTILMVPFGVGGTAYVVAAVGLGAGFFALSLVGLRRSAGDKWAKQLFFASMIYLTGIFAALLLDAPDSSVRSPARGALQSATAVER
jgi:heme o synthase